MRPWAVVVTAIVLDGLGASAPVFGQPSSRAPAGAVTGRLIDATSGAPIGGATVTLVHVIDVVAVEPTTAPSRTFVTAPDGRYTFRNLAGGRYSIIASHSDYLSGGFGARRPAGRRQLLVLGENAVVNTSPIPLWRNAAISGRVVDEDGEPITGARVRALLRMPMRGREFGGEWTATSDDRGMYRMKGLPPGDYLVVVSSIPLKKASLRYPITFYPSVQTPDRATLVAVAAGDDRGDLDVRLTPASGVSIRGIVLGPNGPAAGIPVTLRLPDVERFPFNLDMGTAITGQAGDFSFDAIAPGPYVLLAALLGTPVSAPPGTPSHDVYANSTVLVGDRDTDGVVLNLRPGARVRGRVVFEGGVHPAPSLLTESRVYLDRVDGRWPEPRPAIPDRTGRFSSPALPPGTYRLRIGILHAGWMFKDAMHQGQDIANDPLELASADIDDVVVTYTTRGTRLSGVVRTDRGLPDPDTSVLIFPAAGTLWTSTTSMWRMRSVRSSTDGTYSVTSMPPGDYYVAAVPEERWADWYDPQRLARLAKRATRVRIIDGRSHEQHLRTVRDR